MGTACEIAKSIRKFVKGYCWTNYPKFVYEYRSKTWLKGDKKLDVKKSWVQLHQK